MAGKGPAATKGFNKGREPANKGRKLPVEILTEEEARELIRQCSNRAPTGIRNRALLTVMYRGGLRLGEALALAPKDIDVLHGSITILHGKGDRRRVIGFDPEAVAVVARWLDKRAELGLARRSHLFCTLDGGPLMPSYVRTLLPRLAVKAGIEKRVHPHGLRHTHAAELAREGVAMNKVQAQLGHTSLATTDRYLKRVAPVDLVKEMQGREWKLDG